MQSNHIKNSHPIFENIKQTSPLKAIPVYWTDRNSVCMGINAYGSQVFGDSADAFLPGKTPYDLYPHDVAEKIVQHDQEVIRSGKILTQEKFMRDAEGKTRRFATIKSPLKDGDGSVIGIIGTLVEIAIGKEKIFQDIKRISAYIPKPVYWLDRESVAIGVNEYGIKVFGQAYDKFWIGKRPHDLYSKEVADKIVEINNEIIHTGLEASIEETIKDPAGNIRHFMTLKSALKDDDGNIVGLLNTATEVTAEKEAEQIRISTAIETEQLVWQAKAHTSALQEQELFAQLAYKVAHDISSPLTAMGMMLGTCTDMPEAQRRILRNANTNIQDIANNLLSQYKKKELRKQPEMEERMLLLCSDFLMQLLSQKKYQYMTHPVQFESVIARNAQFAFIQIQSKQFFRTISNLINNAVDAVEDKQDAQVIVKLEADEVSVKVIIEDNGKGMSAELIEKIHNQISFTAGKTSGNGLGLMQIWETLEQTHGKLVIRSELGLGTSISLIFPRADSASWIADVLTIGKQDIIIVLDDDSTIHDAWDLRFGPLLAAIPTLKLFHFKQGQNTLDFIHTLTPQEQHKVFLLSDYELLHQPQHGLQIIAASGVNRAILVTSHYERPPIQQAALKLGVKIHPKQLAAVIPIQIDSNFCYEI